MVYSAGERIYKYDLLNYIGGGEFGEVWLANDVSLNSKCALKLLDQNHKSVDERLLEAKIGNRLQHANVVNIKYADVVKYKGTDIVMIAMPFYKNGAVTTQLNSCNFMPTNCVIKCLIDILRGLEYLHENGYYHCDIKPNNILIGDNGEYILSDYGITCYSPTGTAVHPRQIYLPHISPETLCKSVYDTRTDIYQIGLTAFRLLNGISEISSDFLSDNSQFEYAVNNGKVVTDKKFKFYVPNKLRRIVLKAVSLNPDDRYQSALEMRRALEQIALKGYCSSNVNGEIVMICGNKEYRFDFIPNTDKTSDIVLYQKNLKSGRETKASKFCCKKIKNSELNKYAHKFANELL